MGCTTSSCHKKKKAPGRPITEPNVQGLAVIEPGNMEGKRNATSHDQGFRIGTEPNANIISLKESQPNHGNQNVLMHRRTSTKDHMGAEFHGHPKSSTKETTNGAANQLPNSNPLTKQEDLGRILDEELLKELEKEDSVALDFEELKKNAAFVVNTLGSVDHNKPNNQDVKADMSLTLNLTDLKIEEHLKPIISKNKERVL